MSLWSRRRRRQLRRGDTSVTLSDLDNLKGYFKDCKEKWYDVGLKLGVESDSLRSIRKKNRTEEERLVGMLTEWLTGTPPADISDLWRLEIPSIQSQLEREGIMSQCVSNKYYYFIPRSPAPPPSELPLYRDDLSDSERQQLAASLQQETSDIREKFRELLESIIEELDSHPPMPLHLLIEKLQTVYKNHSFSKATSTKELFAIAAAEECWSFLNFGPLQNNIVESFRRYFRKIHEYHTHFKVYCKRRLRRLPSDGAAVEEKVVMLLDNKMGLQKTDALKLAQFKTQASSTTKFTVTKLIWLEDCGPETTPGTGHEDEGRGEEDTSSAREIDTAPTPEGEPHPPPQQYFMHSKKQYVVDLFFGCFRIEPFKTNIHTTKFLSSIYSILFKPFTHAISCVSSLRSPSLPFPIPSLPIPSSFPPPILSPLSSLIPSPHPLLPPLPLSLPSSLISPSLPLSLPPPLTPSLPPPSSLILSLPTPSLPPSPLLPSLTLSNSLANTTTLVVPSPTSSSCTLLISRGDSAEGIITACHLTFAEPKVQMSDQNLVWSDILANEIIRTRLNVWQFLYWSDILSDHFRKVIIPSDSVENDETPCIIRTLCDLSNCNTKLMCVIQPLKSGQVFTGA